MAKYRKPEFVEIGEGHLISTRGIMSIKQSYGSEITIRYLSGHEETVKGMSMPELLDQLGRNPLRKGTTDSH